MATPSATNAQIPPAAAAGPQPAVQQAASREREPSIREGCIQSCQGYLQKRTKALKRWKRAWFDVVPGPVTHRLEKYGKQHKVIHNFETTTPNIKIEALSTDPKSKDFLSFRLIDIETQHELNRFRADNIVHMRKFMASLGAKGPGLFTKKDETNQAATIDVTRELFDVIHPSEDEIHQRQQCYQERNTGSEGIPRPLDPPPTYTEIIQQLPSSFYFPTDGGIAVGDQLAQLAFPGTVVPMYDPNTHLPNFHRRPWHDTFRPPHGPPVFSTVSIGYGTEVGLDPGLQALWDPVKKIYFFLDHNKKLTFYEDPRPPLDPPPFVACQQTIYGAQKRESVIPPGVCSDRSVIKATAARAHSKPHGHTLYACGVHGQDGAQGLTGATGYEGAAGEHRLFNGAKGDTGGLGGPGLPGTDGMNGQDGTMASDMILNIWGDSEKLSVSGTVSLVAELGGDKAKEVLFVNCRGGDGGSGGRGGDGGVGGVGGRGGDGASGSVGRSSSYGRGEDGRPGGDGGDGGNGGPGGPGGRGGDGGRGQFGGICVIQAADPRLFMLVEVDCMEGTPGTGGDGGNGGRGGDGGRGGKRGFGGLGGSGGSNADVDFRDGFDGLSGCDGSNGRTGPNGPSGERGIEGQPADNGAILWVVSSPEGGVLCQAGTRYDVEVTSLHVASAIDDGIFEPNKRILISEVVVVNSGGLSLPADVTLYMPSTKTIHFEPIRFELRSDQMYPGQSFTVPITYYGRIFDQPPPNISGPFVSSAEFSTRADLLGRPFEKSFLHQKLVVQYPVKLAFLKCPESLGRGEVSHLEIGVQNISTMPYGDSPGSGGKVTLQIHMDARIIPVGSANIETSAVPYTITYDPSVKDSMYIQIHEIPPGETVNVQITVQMESQAELFEHCYWQADLLLRGKLIEYNFEKIRVAPVYLPTDPPADVLMITSKIISRKEFIFWQRIFEILGVNVDFWDTTRYGGLSVDSRTNTRHQVTWEGQYPGSLLLYPHCNLDLLYGTDIVRHFHGKDYRDNPLKDLNSAAVFFMPETAARGRPENKYYDRGDQIVQQHLCAVEESLEISEGAYCGKHLSSAHLAATKPYLKWEKNHLLKLEKEIPTQAPVVLTHRVDIQPVGSFKYSYGDVDIRRIPILRSCKFLVADGAGGSLVDMSLDDPNFHSMATEVPLATNFAQAFLATLYGIPLHCKLKLLKSTADESVRMPQVSWFLPNGFKLTVPELVMICVAWEIADEIYSCSGSAYRMGELAQDVELNTTAYVTNGRVLLRGIKLIIDEVNCHKKEINNALVNQSFSEIKRHVRDITQCLERVGINDGSLQSLVSLIYLVDNERVHRPHQHWVKEKSWNLCGL